LPANNVSTLADVCRQTLRSKKFTLFSDKHSWQTFLFVSRKYGVYELKNKLRLFALFAGKQCFHISRCLPANT